MRLWKWSQLTVALLFIALTTPARADLDGDVRRLIGDDRLKGATVAVSISDAETGESIVSINARRPMIPASNMKLLTTGAALHAYGSDFFFRTQLIRDGDRLIVRGDGDPAFGDPELLQIIKVGDRQGLDIDEFLQLWIRPILDAHISHISELIIDSRIFDQELVHPDWPRDQFNMRYSAEVSGLIFHLNVLHFYPKVRGGAKPDLSGFKPYAQWIDISQNRSTARTGALDGNTFGISRPATSNNFVFQGNVKSTYYAPVAVTLHDMPSFFARLLAERFKEAGVTVDTFRLADEDDGPLDGDVIGPVVRTPIATVVTRCNTDSQNLYAEALIKRLGYTFSSATQPGSWHTGAAALRIVVSERISDKTISSALIVSDGSGFSRKNRVTAALMTAWLNSFHHDPKLREVFIGSLAVGGKSGTLKKRFQNPMYDHYRVQAKSGYIDGVSCLSGYVTSPDGSRRSFSILVNDLVPGTVRVAKQIQEVIVKKITEDMMIASALATEPGG